MSNAPKMHLGRLSLKLMSIALASLCVCSVYLSAQLTQPDRAQAADPTFTFCDVNAKTPHQIDIIWLGYNGISQGWDTKSGRQYRGDLAVIRQDMAAFLHRLGQLAHMDNNVVLKDASFEDVNASTPHANDILWLAKAGVSEGWVVKGKHYFRGELPIKRQDMAAFIHRLADLSDDGQVNGTAKNGSKTLSFVDVNDKTPHKEDIIWMASHGISTGWQEGSGRTFRGMADVNRQDMAAFMHRAATSGVMGKVDARESGGIDIARLASAVSPTAYPMSDRINDTDMYPWSWNKGDSRLDDYMRLGEEVKAKTSTHRGSYKDFGGAYDNWAWASCHQAACVIIRGAVDKDMPMTGPYVAPTYFAEHPEKWQHVGGVTRSDDPMLQPGDILNIQSPYKHTCIYLGPQIAQEYNPGTTGLFWEASYGSDHCIYPGITSKGVNGYLGSRNEVYRFIGTPDGAVDLSKYC